MKRYLLPVLMLAVLVLPSCETGKPKKPKPVPPGADSDVSGLPWNRPRAWEGGAGFGGMMPQSR